MVRALGYKMIPPLGRTSCLSTALCRNHMFINSVGCCARRERPRGDGAADKRDELAASHAEPLVPRDKLSTPHRMERRAEGPGPCDFCNAPEFFLDALIGHEFSIWMLR